jgi:hypothetical protein
MANQTASPHEAAVARELLKQMKPEPVRRRQGVRVVYQTSSNASWSSEYGNFASWWASEWNTSKWKAQPVRPDPDVDEPAWFDSWFGDNLRRQGASEEDVRRVKAEMARKLRWSRGYDPDGG